MAAFRDGVASADVSSRHGLRLQHAPPLESCVRSDELTLLMRMHCCLFSLAAMSDYPKQQQIEMFLINRGNAPTYTSCVRMERFAKWVADSPHIAIRNW